MSQTFIVPLLAKYLSVYLILGGLCLGCTMRSPLKTERRINKIRLSRVWQSSRHLCITAINQRGPLNVWLAKDQDLKTLDLEKSAWIKPDLVHSLQLSTTVNLKGQIQSRLSSVLIDGLKEELSLKFNILSNSQVDHIPHMVDAIIPIEYVFNLKDERQLSISESGHLIQQPITSADQQANTSNTFIYRFKERFDPSKAFPNLVIGTRIDLGDHIHMRWLIPQHIIPKGFWIVTSLDPFNPEQGPLVALRIKKKRQSIPSNPIRSQAYNLIKQTYRSSMIYRPIPQCTSRRPCPIFLKDIMRSQKPCHHDLCVISLQK